MVGVVDGTGEIQTEHDVKRGLDARFGAKEVNVLQSDLGVAFILVQFVDLLGGD
jgi:hypothetical protein